MAWSAAGDTGSFQEAHEWGGGNAFVQNMGRAESEANQAAAAAMQGEGIISGPAQSTSGSNFMGNSPQEPPGAPMMPGKQSMGYFQGNPDTGDWARAETPVVSVDTYADIEAAKKAQENRAYAVAVDTYADMDQAIARTNSWNASGAVDGSVNLAPRGRNVGYRTTDSAGTITFDDLDPSTRTAVKMAGALDNSENVTMTALAKIQEFFDSILSEASKNPENRNDMGAER
jgi:hypothetical protein